MKINSGVFRSMRLCSLTGLTVLVCIGLGFVDRQATAASTATHASVGLLVATPATSSTSSSPPNDDDDDEIATILAAYEYSISPGTANVNLSSWYVVYDASQDTGSTCTPFLDSPGYALSSNYVASTNDFAIQFVTQSPSGSNYRVLGRMGTNGSITQPFKVDCSLSILDSPHDSISTDYAGSQWVNGTFQESGTTYTLVHNEYYGGNFPTGLNFIVPATAACSLGASIGTDINPFGCTYAAVGIASYVTANATAFSPVNGRPGYLVARPSFSYQPNGGGLNSSGTSWGTFNGYITNSNIVKRADGYYYFMAGEGFPNGPPGSYGGMASETIYCPIRASNLADPTTWRAWGGAGYTVNTHSGGDCSDVIPNFFPFYLGYNTYLGKYILIGGAAASPQNKGKPAFTSGEISYAVSNDLVHWIGPVGLGIPIWNTSTSETWSLPNDQSAWNLNNNYASLIDPSALANVLDANSSSSAITGQNPVLLMVQHTSVTGATRLVAIPISFSR
jgi:hypothetical protein